MHTPVIEKTWQFDVNNLVTGLGGEKAADNCLLAIKNSLKGFVFNPWTVWGSSNSINYSPGGGIDYWGTDSDLVRSSGDHSWIVLNSPNGSQICFDLNYSPNYPSFNAFYFSDQGLFTGGTLSARPTALDEYYLDFELLDTTQVYAIHTLHSTDGYNTRVVIYVNNNCQKFFLCDKIKNPSTGFHNICVQRVAAEYYALNRNNYSSICSKSNNNVKCYLTSETFSYVSNCLGENLTYPDDDLGSWYMGSMRIFSETFPYRGILGELCDIWWGSTAIVDGTTYPGDGSKQYVQFKNIILPWNGTVPVLA